MKEKGSVEERKIGRAEERKKRQQENKFPFEIFP
jgi:hypothetical protein